MAWIGFLKKLAVLFFLCIAMQAGEAGRESLLGQIPLIGSIMVVAGALAWAAEPGRSFFYMSGRLGSFFQYPNVFALFCLLGILLLSGRPREAAGGRRWQGAVQMALLVAGVFLSGSRTGLLLMLAICMVQAVRRREWRIPLAMAPLAMLAIAGIYAAATGDMQNIGRFLTASPASETLLERLLCAKDGLRLLSHHPFGLGYLGYYFMEPGIQSGVYSVRYAHNDILQMALDIGIIPAAIFLCSLAAGIFRKGQAMEKRLALAAIGIHCLLEFDLEFGSVWFLLLLLADCWRGREVNIAAGGKLAFYKALAALLSLAGLYTGLAMLPRYLGHAEISAVMLPFYTEAKRDILLVETDIGKAEGLARSLLEQNGHIAEAYNVLALAAYQEGDWLGMAGYKKESLRLKKYGIAGYESCITLLSHAIGAARKQGDTGLAEKLAWEVAEVAEMLNETEESTDPIAYRLPVKPDFELSKEASDYIQQVGQWMGL